MSDLDPGDVTTDREDDGTLVVVAATGHEASQHTVAAAGETVAALNRRYPPDSEVLVCVYRTQLDEVFGDRWWNWPPTYLAYTCGDRGVPTYSFPRARLVRDESAEDSN
jgi:hypothetical protein